MYQTNYIKRLFTSLLTFSLIFSSVAPAYATSTWTNQGSLPTKVNMHDAILLDDGKVFIAGGAGHSGLSITQTQLYTDGSGSSGSWAWQDGLNTSRMMHTVNYVTINTTTGEKRVLAAGGFSGSNPTNKAELWDQSTNNWTNTTSNMTSNRGYHASSMLSNGKVFLTGGYNNNSFPTNTTEVYDPLADTWTAKANMSTARRWHQQITFTDSNSNEKVMVIGGLDSNAARLSSTEIYDPSTNTWSNGPSLSYARYNFAAVKLNDGRILVIGADLNPTKSEVYNPATNAWTTYTTHYSANHPKAVVLGSGASYKVLAAGGDYTANAQLFDPSTNTWGPADNNMNTLRGRFSLTLLSDGNVLAAGGKNSGGVLDSSERFAY